MSELADTDLELPEPPPPGEPFLLLTAAGRWFGVPLDRVLEVVTSRECTRLPGAPAHVLGLVNLRGRVVTVIDLASALRLAESSGGHQRIAVVEHAGKRAGIAVDDTTRILTIDPSVLSPAGPGEELPIESIGEVDGRTLAVLDTDTLVGAALA